MSWVITPSFTQWTPSLISTALWLDAADSSTITLTSGAVSEWRDKSGNARHFSQSTAGSRPTVAAASQNGRDALLCNGTSHHLNGPNSPEPYLIAAVAKTATTSTYRTVYGAQTTSPLPLSAVYLQTGDPARTLSFVRGVIGDNTSTSFYSTAGVVTSGQFFIATGYHNITSITARRNGTPGSTNSNSASLKALSTSIVGAGYYNQLKVDYWPGEIGELIILSTLGVGLLEAEKIEGYLAHKWGLTANLPANHPYKVNPPAP